MSNTELHYKPITEQAAMLRAGELSPVELTSAYLDRISALNDRLGAYITVMGEQAMTQAQKAEIGDTGGRGQGCAARDSDWYQGHHLYEGRAHIGRVEGVGGFRAG